MQEFFNWISNIPNYILNIGKAIYAHIEFISNTNTIFELVISSSAILLFIYNGLKFINGYRAKSLLKIYLSKDELKNLKYYVTTYAQLKPPADILRHSKRFNLIKFFIKDIFQKDKHGKFFIVLGESGMGKSTFLQKLFLKYKRTFFRRHEIYFYPLSNEVDIGEWEQIKNKHNSILLLDALDEDSYAVNDYKKRIDQITMASHEFYKVVITCRTHFFPDEESEPKNIPLIRYGTRTKKLVFFKIYISSFNNRDIDKYLRKRYKLHISKIIQAKKIIEKCKRLMARPLLLSYIDDLLKNPVTYSCISDIYEKLIHEWLCREPCNEELLTQFTRRVMYYMFEHNIPYVTTNEISVLCKNEEIEIINPILARTRSLLTRNSEGKYKFAHKSIYEYMISYEAVYNNISLRRILCNFRENFDRRFYQEISIKYAKKGSKNLSFLCFTGADISDITFFRKNLTGADLKHVRLCGANLNNANLSKSLLSCADLSRAHLNNARLDGAVLYNTNLNGADLRGAILNKANMIGAFFNEAVLEEADLSGANLTKSFLNKADLSRAILRGSNLTESHLDGADLSEADLSGANLFGAHLVEDIIRETSLNRIYLKQIDLTCANLTHANLGSCTLKRPKLNDTIFYEVNITNANIDKETLRYICTQNQ